MSLEQHQREVLLRLIEAAILAPSGDNTQPWRFLMDVPSGCISFFVDPASDPSPMNSGQRMARIAVGAALENVIRTCEWNSGRVTFEEPTEGALVRVRIEHLSADEMRIEEVLSQRATNRRLYTGQPLASEEISELRAAAPPLDGVVTHWILDRAALDKIATLIGRADAAMFGEPAMRQAFLSKVRFDAPRNEMVADGLPLGSLELSLTDRFGLRCMSRVPQWMLTMTQANRVFSSAARRLVRSASGICLLVAPDSLARTDLAVGRSLQRAWLGLTEAGYAVQPMMSLAVLDNVLENGTVETINRIGRARLLELSAEGRELIPNPADGRLAALLRFGYAAAPTARTGRKAISEVMVVSEDTRASLSAG